MANWSNTELVVTGPKKEVMAFALLARTNPSRVFREEMLQGETMDLASDRMIRLESRLYRKRYHFQTRYDTPTGYFRGLSREHPSLSLVLTSGDPNADDFESILFITGKRRRHRLPQKVHDSIMAKCPEDDDDDSGYWEAFWACMDAAEAKWIKPVKSGGR